ncbi:MAG: hypothetical protein R6V17_04470 [Halanaerobacter sp.]
MDRVVDEGILTEPRKKDYKMHLLGASDLEAVVELQDIVVKDLEEDSLYNSFAPSDLAELLGAKGVTIGTVVDGQLIAFCAILFPGLEDNNLGWDLELPQEKLSEVAHLELVAVHPQYRGNSLQEKMTLKVVAEAKKRRTMRYLCETAAPTNYPSVKSTLRAGLVIVKLKLKYHQWQRYIFYQDLLQPVQVDLEDTRLILATDFAKQKEVLAAGYCGIDLKRSPEGTKVLFAREEKGR